MQKEVIQGEKDMLLKELDRCVCLCIYGMTVMQKKVIQGEGEGHACTRTDPHSLILSLNTHRPGARDGDSAMSGLLQESERRNKELEEKVRGF